MRLTIGTRIFLALTAVVLLIVIFNAAVTRWNFQRGFLDYVAEQEMTAITETAASLANLYREEGDWEAIRDNPRRWNDLLRHNTGSPGPEQRPPPEQRRRPLGGRPGAPQRVDPLGIGRRVSLVDADGAIVVGVPKSSDAARSVSIVVDGNTVGYVRIAPQRKLTDQLDQEFARKQERSMYIVAAAALVLAALMSALLARQLTRPIRSLAVGARAISSGDYDARIPETRNDELGDLAHEFNQLALTLERNRHSRRRWVADIAHELRTPLAVLRGELDAIEDGVRQFDRGTRQSLQAEIARLGKLVNELHDLTIYDEDKHSYNRETIDVSAVLRDSIEHATKRLNDADIEVESPLAKTAILVEADATRLERVFSNLIENTLRYTNSPGRLVVRCAEQNDQAVIEFADSAPGVPDQALERLFDRLFRVDESRNRETGGSGLGLAICKAIVEAHDGTIEAIVSDIGGVLIRIRLPLADSESTLQ